MNEPLFWTLIVQWVVCGIVYTVIAIVLSSMRDRRPTAADSTVLRLPHAYAAAGLFGAVFFLGSLALSYAYGAEWRHTLTDLVFLLFAAIMVWLLVDYALTRFDIDDTGLSFPTVFRGRRTVLWSQVREVRYSMIMQCFRLRTTDDAVARIPVTALGLPAFARQVLRHTPAEAFDATTRMRLENIVAGRMPPVF